MPAKNSRVTVDMTCSIILGPVMCLELVPAVCRHFKFRSCAFSAASSKEKRYEEKSPTTDRYVHNDHNKCTTSSQLGHAVPATFMQRPRMMETKHSVGLAGHKPDISIAKHTQAQQCLAINHSWPARTEQQVPGAVRNVNLSPGKTFCWENTQIIKKRNCTLLAV